MAVAKIATSAALASRKAEKAAAKARAAVPLTVSARPRSRSPRVSGRPRSTAPPRAFSVSSPTRLAQGTERSATLDSQVVRGLPQRHSASRSRSPPCLRSAAALRPSSAVGRRTCPRPFAGQGLTPPGNTLRRAPLAHGSASPFDPTSGRRLAPSPPNTHGISAITTATAAAASLASIARNDADRLAISQLRITILYLRRPTVVRLSLDFVAVPL